MKDLYTRDFEDWIITEVQAVDIYPISSQPRPIITYNFREPYTITHNGTEERFNGAKTITFTCSRTNTQLTIVGPSGWESYPSDPERVLRRVAATHFSEVQMGGSDFVILNHITCAEAEDEETNFDSQQVESESQPLEEEDETVVSVTTSTGRKGVRFYG